MKLVLQKSEKLAPEVLQLAHAVGQFIEYWGFKAIHGKVWTLLYLSKDPLSAVELSRKLQVSKALMSFSIAELLEYEVIKPVGKGIKRTLFFRANPHITSVILNVLRRRERPMMSEIESAFFRLQSHQSASLSSIQVDPEQLKSLGEWIQAGKSALDHLVLQTNEDSQLIHQFLLIASVLAQASSEPLSQEKGKSAGRVKKKSEH
jgi:DNA-binding transcriptional regulator GbsR (MarR family)